MERRGEGCGWKTKGRACEAVSTGVWMKDEGASLVRTVDGTRKVDGGCG